jgi:predicted RNA-binding protein YlqC (UPF0109 family)
MKDLVEYIAKALVDSPDDVHVTELEGTETCVIELQVAKQDIGKIIGKRGRIAMALRSLLAVASTKKGKRIVLEILK